MVLKSPTCRDKPLRWTETWCSCWTAERHACRYGFARCNGSGGRPTSVYQIPRVVASSWSGTLFDVKDLRAKPWEQKTLFIGWSKSLWTFTAWSPHATIQMWPSTSESCSCMLCIGFPLLCNVCTTSVQYYMTANTFHCFLHYAPLA